MLTGKRILLGVSGGIAAYKSAALCSALKQAGAEVHVLMTEHAKNFVGAATFEALSGHRVITDPFDSAEYLIPHIRLAQKAELFVVAPATANIIAKLANGIADDMLTSTFLAADCKKLIVPAMNVKMFENPATSANLETLRAYGCTVTEPSEGHLAEGMCAKGKMPEPASLYREIEYLIGSTKDLSGKKIVVTAGATQEALDPVRYLTNRSTGKMGYALAKMAAQRGAEVVLISGRVHELGEGVENAVLLGLPEAGVRDGVMVPVGVRRIMIRSAAEMAEAVKRESRDADCVVMAAAVADFTPACFREEKIKKASIRKETDAEGKPVYALQLSGTEDILSWLGKNRLPGQIIVGFAMETENLIENAKKKLLEKGADLIAANSLKKEGAGFGSDTNLLHLVSREGVRELPLMTKESAADALLSAAFGLSERKDS